MKTLLKLLIAAVAVLFLSSISFADPITAFSVTVVLGVAVTAACVPVRFLNQTLNAGIDMEVWKKYIIEKFRKDNSYIFQSKDDSGFVLGGAVVHIPQAGADPVIVKNRNAYPATAVRRTDTDLTYTLDSYSTDPTHIPWADLQTISFDKLDSVLGNHVNAIGETIADDLLIKWSPAAAQMVRTTGGPTAATVAGVGGQTGTRKGFHYKDLAKAMIAMNLTNTPKNGRIALIDDNMFDYFYDSLTDAQANAFNQFADNKTGQVGKLHGFNIFTRSSVLAYTNADVVKALGAAIAATDQYASLCWHPSTVCRAFGEMKPFQDKDNPLYYGDLYSMIVRGGGRKERADNLGVIAITQAP